MASCAMRGSWLSSRGPAWRSDGTVFFTDVPNNRIMRRTAAGKIVLHRTPSGHANGIFVDKQDGLLIAESDGRIVRENADGSVDVLADSFDGRPFNSPNDLALDSKRQNLLHRPCPASDARTLLKRTVMAGPFMACTVWTHPTGYAAPDT